MKRRGKLICIEGGDGCGKTTTLRLVKQWAHAQDKYPVVFTKEPAGTQMGQQIRKILLNPNYRLSKVQQAYLFAAARRDHIRHVIAPDLAQGKIVICDRYLLSSMAYQGHYVRYLKLLDFLNGPHYRDTNHIMDINMPMMTYQHHTYLPDLNIYLRLNPRLEIKRLRKRRGKHDKFDATAEHLSSLKQLLKNYHYALLECPSPSFSIDASKEPWERADDVIDRIRGIAHISSSINP